MKPEDIVGKAFVLEEDLILAKKNGFKEIEIGLRREDLSDVKRTIKFLEEFSVNIAAVHTPHVPSEEFELLLRSAEIAEHFGALLIFHSGKIPDIESAQVMENIPYRKKALESNPGTSVTAVENLILRRDLDFVLDVAHIYIGSKNFFDDLDYIFKNYSSQVKWVHICDSSPVKDGLAFGKGEIELDRLIRFLAERYSGKMTVEVMPQFQGEARDRILEVLGIN
jgi:sugar phosphate isomerase/epimerase